MDDVASPQLKSLKLRKFYIKERLSELRAERLRLVEERAMLDETLAHRRVAPVELKGVSAIA